MNRRRWWTGLTGLTAGLSGTLITLLVGTLVDRFSYVPAFIVAATAPVVATLSVVFLIRREGKPAVDTPAGPLLKTV